jgi:hypothetical protein
MTGRLGLRLRLNHHRGEVDQVLTIPRSSALRVLGNRCVATSPLCFKLF